MIKCFCTGEKRDFRRLSEGDGISIEKESLKILRNVAKPTQEKIETSGFYSCMRARKDTSNENTRTTMARNSLGDCFGGSDVPYKNLSEVNSWKALQRSSQPPNQMALGTNIIFS